MPLPAWRELPHAADRRRATYAPTCVAAAHHRRSTGALSLDIAGPDVLTYGEMVERIRDALLLGPPARSTCRCG